MTLVVVLDVNILASAAVSEHGLPRVVLRAGLRRQFQLVTSQHILKKLVDTFEKPYFVPRLLAADRNDFLDLLVKRSRSREPDESVRGVAPDLEDDLILGTAAAAHANFLVMGDKGLLAIGEYRGVRVVTAEQFLTEMDFTSPASPSVSLSRVTTLRERTLIDWSPGRRQSPEFLMHQVSAGNWHAVSS